MNTIDRERAELIVEAKFDHEGFSEGVKDTLDDLKKFENGLKLEEGVKGFSNIQSAADKINFTKILSGIESMQNSLSYMQSFAFKVFDSLERRAINWATNMVQSMSTKQIGEGFTEYELKMDSVKTIMNSTGESLETVNKYLEDLNEYSDKTIYSFRDMTSNIGKFTNAGVKLDVAVKSIQGISNLAAVAGANANDASRAMYNFSQALSSGAVKLIDWKSIENANMATKEFKEELIKSAVALGTLTKEGDKYVSTTTDANGNVSKAFDATSNFNESLSHLWMTTDVLTKTLNEYADAETEVGKRAFASAQEVNTYTKMLSALRESVGSGWAQSFEIIFGNLTEATKFWTGINNVISNFIEYISDTRNAILKLWADADIGGKAHLIEGLTRVFTILGDVFSYIGLAFETLFGHRYFENFDELSKKLGDGFSGNIVVVRTISNLLIKFSKDFNELTKKLVISRPTLEKIYQVTQAIIIPLRGVGRVIKGIGKTLGAFAGRTVVTTLSTIINLLSKIGYSFTEGGLQHNIYDFADSIVEAFNKTFKDVTKNLNWFIGQIAHIFGFKNAIDGADKLGDILGGKIIKAIKQISAKLKEFKPTFDTIMGYVKMAAKSLEFGILDRLTKFRDFMKNPSDSFKKTIEHAKEFSSWLKESFKEGSRLRQAIDKIKESFGGVWTTVKTFIGSKFSLPEIIMGFFSNYKTTSESIIDLILNSDSAIDMVANFAKFVWNTLTTKFKELSTNANFGQVFENLKAKAESAMKPVLEFFDGIKTKLTELKENIEKYVNLKGFFEDAVEGVYDFFKGLKSGKKQTKKLSNPVKDLAKQIGGFTEGVLNSVKENIEWDNVLEGVCQKVIDFHDALKDLSEIDISGVLETAGNKIKDVAKSIMEFDTDKPTKSVSRFNDALLETEEQSTKTETAVEKVSKAIKNNFIVKAIAGIVGTIAGLITKFDIPGKVKFVIDTVRDGIEAIRNSNFLAEITNAASSIKTIFEGIDWTSMESISAGIGASFTIISKEVGKTIESINNLKVEKLTDLRDRINELFDSLIKPNEDGDLGTNLINMFINIGKMAVSGLITGIITFDWDKALNVIKGAFGFYFLTKIIDIIKTASQGTKLAGKFGILVDSLVRTVETFFGALKATEWQILANAFFTASKAVVYLAFAVISLSTIPPEGLQNATTALGALILCLTLLALVYNSIKKWTANAANAEATKAAAEATKATAEQAQVIVKGSNIIGEALKSVGATLALAIRESLRLAAFAMVVAAIGFTVGMLVASIQALSTMTDPDFETGMIRLGGIILILAGFLAFCGIVSKKLNADDSIGSIAKAMISLGLAVAIFVIEAAILQHIPFDSISEGMTKLIALIVGISIMAGLIAQFVDGEKLQTVAKGLLLFGLGLLALAAPVAIFTALAGNENFGSAIGAIVLLVGMAALLAYGAAQLEQLGMSMNTFIKAAVGLGLVAISVYVFAQAMSVLAGVAPAVAQSWPVFVGFLLGLTGLIFAIGAVGQAAGVGAVMIGGAMALIGLSFLLVSSAVYVAIAAMNLLVQNMDLYSGMTLEKADAFSEGLSYVIYAVVSAIIRGILMAIAACINGLDQFVAAIRSSLPRLIENLLILIIESVGAILGALIKIIADLFQWIGDTLYEHYPTLGARFLGLCGEILAMIIKGFADMAASAVGLLGKLIPGLGKITDHVSKTLKEGADQMVAESKENTERMIAEAEKDADAKQKRNEDATKKVYDMSPAINESAANTAKATEDYGVTLANAKMPDFAGLLDGGGNGGGFNFASVNPFDLTSQVNDGASSTSDAVQNSFGMLPGMMANMFNAGTAEEASGDFMKGFGVGFDNGMPAVNDIVGGGVDGLYDKFNMDGYDIPGTSEDILGQLGIGFENGTPTVVDSAGNVTDAAVDEFESGDKGMLDAGKGNVAAYAQDGILGNGDLASDSAKVVAADAGNAAGTMAPIWKSNAWYLVKGMADGIADNSYLVEQAAADVANNALASFDEALDEHSPSRKTYKRGFYFVKGATLGIINNAKLMVKAAMNMADDTVDALDTGLNISSVFSEYNPSITPVLDTSKIQNGLNSMDTMFGRTMASSIGASVSVGKVDVGTAVGELSSVTSQGNTDLLDALRAQSRQTEHLIYLLENQKIYLDGNTLVGKTISRIDDALGQRAVLAGRRG